MERIHALHQYQLVDVDRVHVDQVEGPYPDVAVALALEQALLEVGQTLR